MGNIYITKKVRLREEDQFFMYGDYNVTFYWDPYISNGKEYYGLRIDSFDGDTPVAENWLYVPKVKENTYSDTWEKLHDKLVLSQLIRKPRNSRVIL